MVLARRQRVMTEAVRKVEGVSVARELLARIEEEARELLGLPQEERRQRRRREGV
jgi:hypothetical protein